jgi:bifunctional non-homologous end joining protein LigD
VQVKFKHRTPDGMLRQPVFLRMRDDKKPADCVWVDEDTAVIAGAAEPAVAAPEPAERPTVAFTNLDKVFWPADGYTKGDLIAYYEGIAEWLMPYLQDRPVVLTRYPDGIDGKSFFQKDAPVYAPSWLRLETMWTTRRSSWWRPTSRRRRASGSTWWNC